MGEGSSLPVTGGIVKRAQHDTVPKARTKKADKGGDMAHATEDFKRTTDIEVK